ncbi:MAG: DUF421 domain-containing protein [Ruminococcaceae bacterium]|nr:DUF421 domain-containing protein [Oscillospiraceae bacterium]
MLGLLGRTLVLYLSLMGVVRILGKRQVGEMEPAEFVVTMLVSNLAAIPIEETDLPLYSGVIPIATVLGMEMLFSWACMRSVWLRRVLWGKPVILIDNGRILRENLRRTRVTLDELMEQLRQKDVLQPETVQYAILETNGNLSVFPFPAHQPVSAKDAGIQAKKQLLPFTIIADGYLYKENLRLSGRDETWLKRILEEHRCRQTEVFLLTVDPAGKILFLRKDP